MRIEDGSITEAIVGSAIVTPTSEEIRRKVGILPYIEASTVGQIIKDFEQFRTDDPIVIAKTKSETRASRVFLRGLMETAMQRFNVPVQTETGETWPLYDMYAGVYEAYFKGKSDCGACYNGALAGTGFVYEAFSRQLGPSFEENFAALVQTDQQTVSSAVEQSFTVNGKRYTYNDRTNWFQRMNPSFAIPAYQGSLRTGIEHLQTRLSGIAEPIEDGAISTYRTLEALWPALNPPQA